LKSIASGSLATCLSTGFDLTLCSRVIGVTNSETTSIAAFLLPPHNPVSDLHRRLVPLLPAHALPSRYYLIDELPVIGNGKVDLKKLERLAEEMEPILPIGSFEPVSWSLEDVLRATLDLARSLAGYPAPTLSEDGCFYFLAVGGDSLTSAMLVEQVARALACNREDKDQIRRQ